MPPPPTPPTSFGSCEGDAVWLLSVTALLLSVSLATLAGSKRGAGDAATGLSGHVAGHLTVVQGDDAADVGDAATEVRRPPRPSRSRC